MILLNKIADIAAQRVNKYGAQYYTFALFIIVNFPLAYLFEVKSEKLATALWPRLISTLLSIILLLKDKWPRSLKRFIPLFWYITIIFSLPLLGTFLIFKNNFSLEWVINFNIGVVLIMMLLDVTSFIVVEFIGILLGIFLFYISGDFIHFVLNTEYLDILLYMFSYILILGSIFTRNKEMYGTLLQKAKNDLNYDLEQKVNKRTLELKKALTAKEEFLNNMSHEIRTPMHGFTLISDELVLQWSNLTEDKKIRLATQVARDAKRLSSLLNNLLELSTFPENKVNIKPQKIDLKETITAIMNDCRDLYLPEKSLTIEFETNIKSETIEADRKRLNKVIRELMINAIKFSPNNGIIIISLDIIKNKTKRSEIYFKISDSGVGIPEAELNNIFEAFTESTRTKTKAGGTGLGLSICKKIIEAHQGKIWATNNKDGGSTFHFTIPANHKIKSS